MNPTGWPGHHDATMPRREADARNPGRPARPALDAVDTLEAPASAAPAVALLLLARFPRRHLAWGLARLVRGPAPWRNEPGLRFARVLGSGRNGGFGLRPGLDHQGVFLMFDTVAQAQACLAQSPRVAAYRERADESLCAVLLAASARGRWAGQAMQAVAPAPASDEPVVALTRASIRPTQATRFWRHAPASEAALAASPGCLLAVGLGEAPVLRQATLSLWDSTAAMNAYARSGAHQQAIMASYREGYLSEWMFVRFVPLRVQGQWAGRRFDIVRPEAVGHG